VGDEEEKKNKVTLDKFISLIQPDQCIVRLFSNSKMGVIDKKDWLEIVNAKREDKFQILYKNFDI
jgi:hypothetical protein